ncbi:MAG TPA: ABC transporter substrate-binding protein [Actinomycetota bacterium]|nr:ABC transporter substrate-binding protein [Actinomycetota bacterium]
MRPHSVRPRSVFLLVALLGAACPSEPDRTTLPPEPSPPQGTLRLGYPEEPPSLNPLTDPSPASRDILRAVLPTFHVVTPEATYAPYLLAGEPEVERDGRQMTVRFEIRDDARWSDGRPITVADVAFTWRATTRLDGVVRTHGFDRLVAVEEESPTTGRLVLRPPLASWRDLFSAGRFVIPAHAADRLEDVLGWDGGPPVTAGPFRLGRWTRGRSVTLEADPRFWGEPAGVARIDVGFVPDPTTALQLLDRDALDAVAPMAGISWGRRLDAIPGVSVSEAFGPTVVDLVVNAASIPDAAVRRRVLDGIDRDRLVEVALPDDAVVADGLIPSDRPGAVPAWEEYGRGRASSVALPGEIDLVYPRAERTDLVARYVQAELERIGVDVELVGLEADVFHGTFLAGRRFDLALWEDRSGPTPELWPWVEAPGAGRSLTGLGDDELADLVERSVGGGAAGDAAVVEAQQRLADLAVVLPLFGPEVTVGWRDGVSGLVANPTVDGPLWNAGTWAVDAT